MKKIPKYLKSTVDLIESAFETGPPNEYADCIVVLLFEHMAEENLFKIFHHFFPQHSISIESELYHIVNNEYVESLRDTERFKTVLCALKESGYEKWCNEID